jgi:hypothetical protein
VPIEPQEDPPIKPGQPSEPPQESPPGSPRPEVPPPMPDELPVRGPDGPRGPSPATDTGIADLPGSGPDLNPGAPEMPQGTM